MPADPFEPLRRVDPPDQWDDIAARTAEASTEPHAGDPRRSRRPQVLALAAAAIALVALVGAIAVAATGDRVEQLDATLDEPAAPPDLVPGDCPFWLEPGSGVPTLRPGPLSFDPTDTVVDGPTVGIGQVDGIEVEVAAATFPASPSQQRARWSADDDAGIAIGWFDPVDPPNVGRLEVAAGAGAATATYGGGHLGGPDERCRDVLVSVAVPESWPAPRSSDPAALEAAQEAMDAAHARASLLARQRLEAVLGAIRFPEDGPEATVTPTTATSLVEEPGATDPLVAGPLPGPDDFGGTLPDGRDAVVRVSEDEACVVLDDDPAPVLCASLPRDGTAMGTIDGPEGEALLMLGAAPAGAVETNVLDPSGARVDTFSTESGAGLFLAFAPVPFDPQGQPVQVVHLDADGNPLPTG